MFHVLGGCFLDSLDAPLQQEAMVSGDGEIAVGEQGVTELGDFPRRQVLLE